jgi:REP element-mobilizing transposase RayT
VSRQLRLDFPGAIWHITSRGNERRDIYRDATDRRRFLSLLAHVVAERRWRLHAWVLMSNHYHLLIETPEVGLSRGIKWLNQEYAESFNARHDRVGHLFQGRFKGILVERETHLLELVRYIVLNPVRSGLVKFAGEYQWSNYRATAGLHDGPPWLDVGWTLDQFGLDRRAAHEAYRRFVAEGRDASYDPREALAGEIYLGSKAFRERMQTLVDTKVRSGEHPKAQRELLRPGIERIVTLVCERYSTTVPDLRRKSRGPARKALCHLALTEAGLTLHAVASWFEVSEWAASKMRSAAQVLYSNDAEFREAIDRIRSALSCGFQM